MSVSKLVIMAFVVGLVFSSGCTTVGNIKKSDQVTLILNDGVRIKAQIVELTNEEVRFRAKDVKKAFLYGEVLPRQRVEQVQLTDGVVLTLDEYEARAADLKKREALVAAEPEMGPASVVKRRHIRPGTQYEELKKKPISEMTDNEFRFFMMMQEREAAAQQKADSAKVVKARDFALKGRVAPRVTPRLTDSEPPQRPVRLTDAVESLVDAGLASRYFLYLTEKQQKGQRLYPGEVALKGMLSRHEKWKGSLEEMAFVSRVAEKSMARAYLHNPEALQSDLGLTFDPDRDMDLPDLLAQLHRRYGNRVEMREFRKFVEIFGEDGARAIKDVLSDPATFEIVTSHPDVLAGNR